MGMLESGQTWSHEQLVIDNDIVAMNQRAIQGIDVTDDTMGVDVIKKAHEIKEFLHQKHTVQFMRRQSKSKLIDRQTRGAWEAKGGKDMTQRAKEEVRRILDTHQPEPLAPELSRELAQIIHSVENH